MTDFPSNSRTSPPQEPDPKKVESVVSNEAIQRKKSLGRRFKDVLIGGDSKSVVHYIVMDVLVPQVKDLITDAATQSIERMIYGDSRPGRRLGSRPTMGPGPTNYTRYSRGNNPLGRQVREEREPTASLRKESINDILLATRLEAEVVIDRMYDLLGRYESVSIADLYALIDWSSSHVDQKWGWTDLHGSRIVKVRDGYILEFPKPQPLD
jgi:hypothetical protein